MLSCYPVNAALPWGQRTFRWPRSSPVSVECSRSAPPLVYRSQSLGRLGIYWFQTFPEALCEGVWRGGLSVKDQRRS